MLPGGGEVALKLQYPGVSQSIDSDIGNLVAVLNLGQLFPRGLFLENFVAVASRELRLECDYLREAKASKYLARLLQDDQELYVPKVRTENVNRM